jgi:hypothetical protein
MRSPQMNRKTIMELRAELRESANRRAAKWNGKSSAELTAVSRIRIRRKRSSRTWLAAPIKFFRNKLNRGLSRLIGSRGKTYSGRGPNANHRLSET